MEKMIAKASKVPSLCALNSISLDFLKNGGHFEINVGDRPQQIDHCSNVEHYMVVRYYSL